MSPRATAGQQRFWMLEQQGHPTTVVHRVTIDGAVDPERLRAAIAEVLDRQPALRTGLVLTDQGLRQRVFPAAAVPVTAVSPTEDVATLVAAARAPFRQEHEPLSRFLLAAGPTRTDCYLGVHHGLFDDTSAGILVRELAAAYAATGESSRPEPSDEILPSPDHRLFWERYLTGCPADTTLPQIRPATGHGRATVAAALDAGLVAAADRWQRERGTTIFAQALAATAAVVGWYSDTTDVVLATICDTRDATQLETIGCVQNTVPVRFRPEPFLECGDYLDRSVDALFDVVEHAALPWEEIVASAGPARAPGRKALTQILCAQRPLPQPVRAAGATWNCTPIERDTVEYDLAVTLDPAGIVVEYHPEKLTEGAGRAFLDHVLAFWAHLVAPGRHTMTDVVLAAGAVPAMVGAALTAAELPVAPASILDRTAATPHAVAVRATAGALTYAELDARVSVLAAALAEQGVRRGDRVGICLARTVDLPVAVLAVWRAGASYLPLDPEYPSDRLSFMLDDARPVLVIADRPLPSTARVLAADARPAGPMPATWAPPDPADEAYVIYTSGSTGRPKGVVIRHANVAALLASCDRAWGAPPPVFVAATSLSFDISVIELLWPLANGSQIQLTSHHAVTEPDVPAGAGYQCTPSVARILVADPAGRALLSRLGLLLIGGEALPEDLAAALATTVPGRVVNCYGPTETTVWSTAWELRPGAPVHIGRPLAGETCVVLDSHGRPLPPGSPGRLHIGGLGVGAGYADRPELTAERFARGPDGAVRYDTGDLVVVDEEHGLRFLGRDDGQVKVLGQRIELGEVEAVVRRHPLVDDVAVSVSAGGTDLVAAVVLAGTGEAVPVPVPVPATAAAEFRAFCAATLPRGMVPTGWLAVPAVPLLPNGKRDRTLLDRWLAAGLPAGAGNGAPGPDRRGTVAAGTAAETAVQGAWSAVLPVPVADLDQSFYALGGTSADVLRALVALRGTYPQVTAADFFRHPTLRALAAHLDTADARTDDERSVAASATGRAAARTAAFRRWAQR
jgi:amino acid adenylation domain-containing protein